MKHQESRLQAACVQWFNYAHPHLRGLLFAVPNGGRRDAVTGKILKAEGVVAGVADLILLHQTMDNNCLCIEMKTAKGRQQESQKEWQEKAERGGARYVICRSLEDFINITNEYVASIDQWREAYERMLANNEHKRWKEEDSQTEGQSSTSTNRGG